MIVTGLLTSVGVHLANPATDPVQTETVPTANPSFTQPVESSQGGKGGGVTPDSALGYNSIRPGAGGQASVPNSAALNAGANPMAQQAVRWPLSTGDKYVTSGFGPRSSPCSGCSSNHRGLDFAGAVGSPIGSISAGVVIDVTDVDRGGLGVHVVIEHRIDGKLTRSVYAHMLEGSLTVNLGDVVLAGERIGSLGNTGSSTGPHLHLEVIVQGSHVDPYTFLKRYADDEDVEVIDRPPVEWVGDQDPDAEGEGWTPDEDTLTVDPSQLPDVDTGAPEQTEEPEPTAGSRPTNAPSTDAQEPTEPSGTPEPDETTAPVETPQESGTAPPPTGSEPGTNDSSMSTRTPEASPSPSSEDASETPAPAETP